MVVCRFESCGRSQTTSVPDQLVSSVRPSLDPVQVSPPLVSRDPLWGSLLAARCAAVFLLRSLTPVSSLSPSSSLLRCGRPCCLI